MSVGFRLFLGVFAILPTMLSAQGDMQAYTDAYAKCMQQKPQYATTCYDFSCAFQGCVAQYSSVGTRAGVAIADPSLREASIPACMPHIQAMTKCIKENGLIQLPEQPGQAATVPRAAGQSLSCQAGDNTEGGCCCFRGSHTYEFPFQQVSSATIRFDTGRKLNCQSSVSIRARIDGSWQTLQQIAANSSSGDSEVAPITVDVPVNNAIDGLLIEDGCVCCIDDSAITLH